MSPVICRASSVDCSGWLSQMLYGESRRSSFLRAHFAHAASTATAPRAERAPPGESHRSLKFKEKKKGADYLPINPLDEKFLEKK